MNKSRDPWERIPEETSKRYAAFCIYRDIGSSRSIQKVVHKWSGSGGLSKLKEWSSKHHWIERVAAYDAHIDKIRRSGHEDEIKEMSARHAREAQLFQDKAIERLKTLDMADLKPHEIIKFYDIAVRIERLSRGVPTENIKQKNEVREVKGDAITPEKLRSPEVRKAANKFIKTIADSQSSTDGIGTDS